MRTEPSVERLDPRIDAIVPCSPQIELLASAESTLEGPVWFRDDGVLIYSEVGVAAKVGDFAVINQGRRMRWDPATRTTSVLEEPTGMGNGMTRDPQGRLVICEGARRQVARIELDGSRTVVASHYRGQRLSAPNDVVVKSDGSIYFTDPSFMPGGDLDYNAVFRVSPDLQHINRVAWGFQLVNGLTFSHDERVLYINDSQGIVGHDDMFFSRGTIHAYDVRSNGTLINPRLFAELGGELSGIPDGMKADTRGNVYCTGPGGIWIFDADGTHLGTVLLDVKHNMTDPTNMCWGGENWRTLYITTCTTLLCMDLLIPGVPVPARRN